MLGAIFNAVCGGPSERHAANKEQAVEIVAPFFAACPWISRRISPTPAPHIFRFPATLPHETSIVISM